MYVAGHGEGPGDHGDVHEAARLEGPLPLPGHGPPELPRVRLLQVAQLGEGPAGLR